MSALVYRTDTFCPVWQHCDLVITMYVSRSPGFISYLLSEHRKASTKTERGIYVDNPDLIKDMRGSGGNIR